MEAVLGPELARLSLQRCMLLATPDRAFQFNTTTGKGLHIAEFTDVRPHVPEAIVAKAVDQARMHAPDGLIAFGGGSTIDTAKAVAHRLHVSVVAIPTNFSGSEVTWNYGLTSDGSKQTMRDPSVLPGTVIYDPSLLASLPDRLWTCSSVNAMAHAIEALYAPQSNPLTAALAEEGIRKVIAGLRLKEAEGGKKAATCSLMGSWLCGEVLSQVGMGFHHRICHVLGGTYGLAHAETHTVLLPISISFVSNDAPALAVLRDLFPAQSLADGIAGLAQRGGAPASLQDLGFREKDIPEVARLALRTPTDCPRSITVPDIEGLLLRAFRGYQLSQPLAAIS